MSHNKKRFYLFKKNLKGWCHSPKCSRDSVASWLYHSCVSHWPHLTPSLLHSWRTSPTGLLSVSPVHGGLHRLAFELTLLSAWSVLTLCLAGFFSFNPLLREASLNGHTKEVTQNLSFQLPCFIFLISVITTILLFIHCFTVSSIRTYGPRLPCSLLSPTHLPQCLAHRRHAVFNRWRKGW